MPLALVHTVKGELHVWEPLPFDVKRVYFLTKTPHGSSRGGHTMRTLHRLMVMAHGSCRVTCTRDGAAHGAMLSNPGMGYYLPPGWRVEIDGLSEGAVVAVLCSDLYDEGDYIR